MKLANIKKVDLREVWKHEALEFTQWLAGKERRSAFRITCSACWRGYVSESLINNDTLWLLGIRSASEPENKLI